MRKLIYILIALIILTGIAWLLYLVLPPYVWHPLGACPPPNTQGCRGYNLWSGIVSDISEVTVAWSALTLTVGLYKHHNCEEPGCPKLGHPHPDHMRPVCRTHYHSHVPPKPERPHLALTDTDHEPGGMEFTCRERMLGTHLLRNGGIPDWSSRKEAEAYALKVAAYTESGRNTRGGRCPMTSSPQSDGVIKIRTRRSYDNC